MGLELNDIRVPYRDFRTDKIVKYVQQMPLLIADDRNPISVAEVMERRLNSEQPDWDNNYLDTGDAVALSARDKDKFKIVRRAPFLRRVTSDTILSNGALVLEEGIYSGIAGPEFSRKRLGDLLNRDLSLDKIGTHPVWLEIVGDEALLKEYAGRKFAEMKERFNYDSAMGIYLLDAQKVDTARALTVDGLGDRSQVGDRYYLDDDDGQLVGVAPEARAGMIIQPSLEQALAVINRHSGELNLRIK